LFRKTAVPFPLARTFEWKIGAKPPLIERTGAKRKRDSEQHQEMVCSSLT
jgi:hypothetical protein